MKNNNSFRVKCIDKKDNLYFQVGKEYGVTFGKLHCNVGWPEVNSDIYGIPDVSSVEELNEIFNGDCEFELYNEEYADKQCPFCETNIKSRLLINTICPNCNAKYYILEGKWIKR